MLIHVPTFQSPTGPLSNDSPIPLFGLSPIKGSYLEILNLIISPKSTQILFNITWINLPINFKEYYKGYILSMELVSPEFAFGLSLYPEVLNNVVMKNIGKNQCIDLPFLPFILIANKIELYLN